MTATAEIQRQQLIDWYYSTLNALATATPETRPAIEARVEDIRSQIEALGQ